MVKSRKIAITVSSVIAALLLFIWAVLPIIVRGQLEKQLAKATDRRVSVTRVRINPLLLTLKLEGIRLDEKDANRPFVSFESLKLRVSPLSIWYLAPVVAELKLKSPYIYLRRDAANSFNFTDIIEKNKGGKKSEKPPCAARPRGSGVG